MGVKRGSERNRYAGDRSNFAARRTGPGSGVRDVINVSQALLNWLRAFDPTKAIEVSALFDQYIKEMLR